MRVIPTVSVITCVVMSLLCAGCQQPLPTYATLSADATIETLRRRFDSIDTIAGGCRVTFTSAKGETVNLDGALAARNPGWLRLRAWKFNTAVFDVTVTPEARWLFVSDDASQHGGPAAFDVTVAQIADAWQLINGGFFDLELVEAPQGTSRKLVCFRTIQHSSPQRMCTVDRETLTPLMYAVFDEHDAEVFRVELKNYQLINGIPWANRLSMTSAYGRVDVACSEMELNGELADRAFVPPQQAEKQP